MQTLVLVAFVGLSLIVLVVMLGIARSSWGPPLPQAPVQKSGYALRRFWFFILSGLIVAALAASLPQMPYAGATDVQNALHVKVVSEQFAFELPAQLPADKPIVFDVTSKDVNHGFGIYDPKGRLIAQVQAMPGYINHLSVTFHQHGRYTVRCLEFCGIGHAAMESSFTVS